MIYTDIAKDGLLAGTNLAAYEQLQAIKGLRVIASGGISSEEDLKSLRDLDVYGAIIGKGIIYRHTLAQTGAGPLQEAETDADRNESFPVWM